jgi:hypothetical protein
MIVGFDYEKNSFQGKILKPLSNNIFWSAVKTHKIHENSTFFFIYEFFISKNRVIVGFGYEKSSFSGRNTRIGPKLVFWSATKTHAILRQQHLFLDLNLLFPKIK